MCFSSSNSVGLSPSRHQIRHGTIARRRFCHLLFPPLAVQIQTALRRHFHPAIALNTVFVRTNRGTRRNEGIRVTYESLAIAAELKATVQCSGCRGFGSFRERLKSNSGGHKIVRLMWVRKCPKVGLGKEIRPKCRKRPVHDKIKDSQLVRAAASWRFWYSTFRRLSSQSLQLEAISFNCRTWIYGIVDIERAILIILVSHCTRFMSLVHSKAAFAICLFSSEAGNHG